MPSANLGARRATASASDSIPLKILADQLADIKSGIYVSMPISTILSAMILTAQMASGHGSSAVIWFLLVNTINVARIVLAASRLRISPAAEAGIFARTETQVRQFKFLALLSGIAWALLALLTHGYTIAQSSLYLIILAGISAGAVTYGASCAAVPISFLVPPLTLSAGCLLFQKTLESDLLACAILLFLVGLVRASFVGQARFCEASRLKHEAEETALAMEHSSKEDPLTGLLNRRGLEDAVERFRRLDGPFTIFLIDLDGFKSVNDTYGHKAGDNLLVDISDQLKRVAPAHSVLSRIGGDEFILFYPAGAYSGPASEIAAQIIEALTQPYPTLASVEIGACVGIYRSREANLTEMLLHADHALYAAKRLGRNRFCLFNAEHQRELDRRRYVERDLRAAIESGQIRTAFQPIVRLEDSRIVGFEALLRWRHEVHGIIPPPEIINAARDIGLIQQLTECICANCCRMIEGLLAARLYDMRVAMNLAPHELSNIDIEDVISSALRDRGLPADMLEIEITEEGPIDWNRMSKKLRRLSDLGISFVLDDFGKGCATISSLKGGLIHKLKIDRSFIDGIANSSDDRLLVKALIDLCRAMKIEVTAEGIETEADCAALRELGCTMGQGYLLYAPLELAEAIGVATRGQQQRIVIAKRSIG